MSGHDRHFYLAVNFNHDEPGVSLTCARYLSAAFEFALKHDCQQAGMPVPDLASLHLVRREGFRSAEGRSISLVANIAYSGEELAPPFFSGIAARFGRELDQEEAWRPGEKISFAKLYSYGKDIFRLMDEQGIVKTAIPVRPDAGCPGSFGRKLREKMGDTAFSLNTSRRQPHWIGRVVNCAPDTFIRDRRDTSRIKLERLL